MNKQPKLSDLKLDVKGTQSMRVAMAKAKKIKITINLDADLVSQARQFAQKRDIPYQRYLNRILRTALLQQDAEESRIDRLERELAALKRQLVA